MDDIKAIEKAISFFKAEKQQREKGCECCILKENSNIGDKVYLLSVRYYVVGDGKLENKSARFCPICGRDLRHESEEN